MEKVLVILLSVILLTECGNKNTKIEKAAQVFIDSLTTVVEPLLKESSLAYWDATATGKEECYTQYAQLNMELTKVYSNKADFEKIKKFREFKIKDPLLKRQLDVVYYDYVTNQADTALLNQITQLAASIEGRFNTFRGKIDSKEISGNDIKQILINSTNMTQHRKAWEASKQVAQAVEADLLKLVHLRNEAAKQIGFNNFYEMSLISDELDPAEIARIFKELDRATQEPFKQAKAEIDIILAKRYNIKSDDLRPWHYADPFFQEVPILSEINLDKYYEKQNVIELGRRFYDGIGLNVDSILAKSDLYERENKYPHAYCTDIDRAGDVRIMVNVRNNDYWLSTVLHELGHGVYSYNVDHNLPYLLRTEAHTFTTEAVAMFFEKLSKNPDWIQQMLGLSDEEKAKIVEATAKTLRYENMIFACWSLVVLNFEKEMYEDPDQDLNKLWWDLVEKYQLINRPENRNMPDWASKIHICSYPVYYHNYQLGGLLAAQLMNAVAKNQGFTSINEIRFVNNPAIGDYLKTNIFFVGKKYKWDDIIVRATGEKLTAKYFVEQL